MSAFTTLPVSTLDKKTVHVAIVLDSSGSMAGCLSATVHGFNELVVQTRQSAVDQQLNTKMTLTTFNHHVAFQHFKAGIDTFHRITAATYRPSGRTALFDAIGQTIDRLEKEVKNPIKKHFLVSIFTDGYENASHSYNQADIAERIERLTTAGNWTFTFIGAAQDLAKVSTDLHISASRTLVNPGTPEGSERAWSGHGRATERYMRGIRDGASRQEDFYQRGDTVDASTAGQRTL